jgi:hypothetical protein
MFLLLVTLISLVLAIIMGAIAWRVSQEERRRSNARVARLAADINGLPAEPVDVAPVPTNLELREFSPGAHTIPVREHGGDMFARPSTTHATVRLAAVAVIGLLVFGSAATVAVVLGRGASQDAGTKTVAADADAAGAGSQRAAPKPAVVPLELVALGHERDSDRLTVRGIVRNPSGGAEVDHISAVVFVFSRDGGFVGSGRAAIEAAALAPGGESGFVVTLPGATDVTRYRVSFRTDDRIVPHVDRRDPSQAKE